LSEPVPLGVGSETVAVNYYRSMGMIVLAANRAYVA
jgi:hypothetical protein